MKPTPTLKVWSSTARVVRRAQSACRAAVEVARGTLDALGSVRVHEASPLHEWLIILSINGCARGKGGVTVVRT